MLNTHKLLYILPQVAYIAELLPGKKPTTYKIQSFHQVNGEFMNDNEFLGKNVVKLFKKIDPEDYHLILPDFLFTNTIVNIDESTDSKIKTHLSDKLLPTLGINTDDYQVDTTVLTEHGGSSKVQLSAIEKSLLLPIQVACEESGVKVSGISPLSWTAKSLVSLEPSISVVQINDMLYSALHYIGVDQTSQAENNDVDSIHQTIKTLKGAEPSVQTVYLLSNELVEDQLKEKLSETLPIQQLAQKQDGDSKMPSYVKKLIEAGMRTLSIEDYPVPKFELGKAPAGAVVTDPTPETDNEMEEEMSQPEQDNELPTPTKPTESLVEETPEEEAGATEDEKVAETEVLEPEGEEETAVEDTSAPSIPTTKEAPEPEVKSTTPEEDDEIEALLSDLKTDRQEEDAKEEAEKKTETTQSDKQPEQPKKVIKNKDKTKSMMKMVFVTLAVFFATVGVGIGIGLGVLQLTNNQGSESTTPVAEVSPSPQASPSPSPSPEPELDVSLLSVLVVNATTTPGYAGETADDLETAEFGTVDAGNASGDYEDGFYVLMEEENQTLIAALEEATDLSLTYDTEVEVEDPAGEYDAVIVLAE